MTLPPPSRGSSCRPGDHGAAVVDFALVAAVLTLLFVAVVQLGVVLHVRNTLIDCASEGARYASFADRSPQDGVQRTRELIAMSLSERYASDVRAGVESFAGVPTVVVRVQAPLPVLGLLGPPRTLSVAGHAADEP